MKRLWYVGPGLPECPEGVTRPENWADGVDFTDDAAARCLAIHGPEGSGQWSETAPGEQPAPGGKKR